MLVMVSNFYSQSIFPSFDSCNKYIFFLWRFHWSSFPTEGALFIFFASVRNSQCPFYLCWLICWTDVGALICITEHMQDIVGLLFKYISLLRQTGVCKWIFDEVYVVGASMIEASNDKLLWERSFHCLRWHIKHLQLLKSMICVVDPNLINLSF